MNTPCIAPREMARLIKGELILTATWYVPKRIRSQNLFGIAWRQHCNVVQFASTMTLDDHHTTLSRTTSRTSHRSRNSSLSRTQSLVKKNIGLIDLKPADVLIERFVAWKVIVKQLSSYFEVRSLFSLKMLFIPFIGCR